MAERQKRKSAGSPRRKSSSYNYKQLLWVIATGVTIYVLASFLIAGVGPVGQSLSSKLLGVLGGAVIFVLAHLLFELFRTGMGIKSSHQLKQWIGTFFAYLSLTIASTMARFGGVTSGALTSPGFVGNQLSGMLNRTIGALGIMLVGLICAFVAAFFYGLLTPQRLKAWRAGVASLSSLSPRRIPSAIESLRKKQAEAELKQQQEVSTGIGVLHEVISPEQQNNKGSHVEVLSPLASNKGEPLEVLSPDHPIVSQEEQEVGYDAYGHQIPAPMGNYQIEEPSTFDPSFEEHIPVRELWQGAKSWLYGKKEDDQEQDIQPMLNIEKPAEQNQDLERQLAQLRRQMPGASLQTEEEAKDESDQEETRRSRFWSLSRLGFGKAKVDSELDEKLELSEEEDVLELDDPTPEQETSLDEVDDESEDGEIDTLTMPQVLDQALALEAGRDLMRPSGKSYQQDISVHRPKPEVHEEVDVPVEVDVVSDDAVTIPDGSFPPPLDLLGLPAPLSDDNEDHSERGEKVISALRSFGVEATLEKVVVGPTIIQFQIQLARGVKVNQVARLEKDLALHLAVPTVRVEAPIEGTTFVGIELPNPKRRAVSLRTVLESPAFENTSLALPLPLGQTVDGRVLLCDLAELPHLLVAGTTGSGKSIFVNNCITTLCYHLQPHELKFIMVDPKRVEMAFYRSLPHMLAEPVCNGDEAMNAMAWAVREMERRYSLFADAKARNLASYNAKVLPKNRLPFIVVIVDEFADLIKTSPRELEDYIIRLAQMARATGIHLILATQRPSADIITGTIKANIPARAAFSLPSVTDSRIILDNGGAETLLGRGDMLFMSTRHPRPLRIQSPFLDESANLKVVDYLANLYGKVEHIDFAAAMGKKRDDGVDTSYLEDDRLREAVESVLMTGIASSSRLQRALRVGFTRAARMIDAMEMMGIVGPADGTKPREVLVDEEEADDILERHGVR